MANLVGAERKKAVGDALRRNLGMEPRRNPKNKKHGSRHRKAQKMRRKTSRESRQVATS